MHISFGRVVSMGQFPLNLQYDHASAGERPRCHGRRHHSICDELAFIEVVDLNDQRIAIALHVTDRLYQTTCPGSSGPVSPVVHRSLSKLNLCKTWIGVPKQPTS